MTTKHTPGPWDWRDGDDLRQAKSTRDDGRYGHLVLAADYDYDRGAYLETTDENRSLIRAAPDMFEALELARIVLEDMDKHYATRLDEAGLSALCAIEAAVTKAKGPPWTQY